MHAISCQSVTNEAILSYHCMFHGKDNLSLPMKLMKVTTFLHRQNKYEARLVPKVLSLKLYAINVAVYSVVVIMSCGFILVLQTVARKI